LIRMEKEILLSSQSIFALGNVLLLRRMTRCDGTIR